MPDKWRGLYGIIGQIQRFVMDATEITTTLATWQQDITLRAENNLAARMKALADVALAQELVRLHGKREDWTAVAHQAALLQAELAAANGRLFQKIRQNIQAGRYDPTTLRHLFNQFTGYTPEAAPPLHMGEDGLDLLLNGILQVASLPEPMLAQTAEMVHLEVTPARAILDMIDHVPIRPDDVFYDVGSGLGHVVILVAWLAGIQAKGVEIDPGYCQRARQLGAELRVRNAHFIQGDARTAAYHDGTIFFMFTPFTGQMLHTVLSRLETEARKRPITLCTYGTITLDVAQQPWLQCLDRARLHQFKLAIFQSGRCG